MPTAPLSPPEAPTPGSAQPWPWGMDSAVRTAPRPMCLPLPPGRPAGQACTTTPPRHPCHCRPAFRGLHTRSALKSGQREGAYEKTAANWMIQRIGPGPPVFPQNFPAERAPSPRLPSSAPLPPFHPLNRTKVRAGRSPPAPAVTLPVDLSSRSRQHCSLARCLAACLLALPAAASVASPSLAAPYGQGGRFCGPFAALLAA